MSPAAFRVLVVEDEILIALELENLLGESGHEVVGVAGSFPEAAELAERRDPQLALVDIHLADGPSGLDVARHLAARGVAVVFMSANTKRIPEDFAGGVAAVAKPYTERGVRNALSFLTRVLSGKEAGDPPDTLLLAPDLRERLSGSRMHSASAR